MARFRSSKSIRLLSRGASLLIDYGMLTATQLGTMVLIARHSTPSEFGIYTLAVLLTVTTTTVFTGVIGVWITTGDPARLRLSSLVVGGAIAASWPLLIAVAVGAIGMTLAWGMPTLSLGIVLATVGRIVLESKRALDHMHGRPRESAAATAFGFALFIVLAAVWLTLGRPGDWSMPILIQGVAWMTAGVAVLLRHRALPTRAAQRWLRSQSRGSWRGHGSLSLAALFGQFVTPLAILFGSSYATLGAIRGAQSLLGLPAQLPLALTPRLAARLAGRKREVGHLVRQDFREWVIVIWGVTGPAVLVLLVLPEAVGVGLFGQSWDGIRPVLPFVAAATALNLTVDAFGYYFRVEQRMGPFVRLRWGSNLLVIAGSFVGATLGGAIGAAVASALIALITLLVTSRLVPTQHPHADPRGS